MATTSSDFYIRLANVFFFSYSIISDELVVERKKIAVIDWIFCGLY